MTRIIKSLSLVWLFGMYQYAVAQDKPNILYIMSDDHSAAAVGVYESHLKDYVSTPNIDKLAKEGAFLTNVVCNNALCVPSRASIITGKYSHQNGVYTLRESLNTTDMPTLPKVMQKGGYQTAVVGKWHLKGDNLQGFDYYAITRGQGSYFNPTYETREGEISKEGHSSDAITDMSLEWLEKRDKDKPFMLLTHYKSAHGLWEFAPRYKDMYANESLPEPPNLFDNFENRDPAGVGQKTAVMYQEDNPGALAVRFSGYNNGIKKDWPTGNFDFTGKTNDEKVKLAYQKYIKEYLRCVKGIDDGVGRILAYLEEIGELDNTVIIYTSDQGMYLGEHGFYDKRLALEEALRMPFVIRYPKAIKAGQKIDALVNNVDFPETIIDFAGLEIPAEMQGFSFKGIVTGKDKTPIREASFYQFYSSGCPPHFGIRTKNYKLLKYVDTEGKVAGMDIYDIRKDPWEMKNVANDKKYKKRRAELEALLAQEIKTVGIKPGQFPGEEGWKE